MFLNITHRAAQRPLATLTRLIVTAVLALISVSLFASNAAAQLKAEVAAGEVILSWTAPGDDGNTGTAALYDLRYSRSPITAANWNDWNVIVAAQNEPRPAAAGTVQEYILTDLPPGTTYYFAIRAGDEANNWSGLSNVVTVKTPTETVPPAAITDLNIISTGDNSVTLGWTAPGDDGTTGQAAQYEVRYSTSPITATNWAAATLVADVPTPKAPGSPETLTVASLQSGVTYYFAVKTADENPNWSALSNVVNSMTSGDTTPPAPVSDLRIAK